VPRLVLTTSAIVPSNESATPYGLKNSAWVPRPSVRPEWPLRDPASIETVPKELQRRVDGVDVRVGEKDIEDDRDAEAVGKDV